MGSRRKSYRVPENNYITRSYEIIKNNEKTLEEINSKLGGILLIMTRIYGDGKIEKN